MIASAVVVLVAAVVGPVAIARGAPGDAPATGFTFADEFNGAAGGRPDPAKWTLEVGGNDGADGGPWGNHELQYYSDSPANSALDGNGNLVITAREEATAGAQCEGAPCRYTSARLTSIGKFSQAFGRFEARIKMPPGQGLLPAFWMLGDETGGLSYPASGEIDVVEVPGTEPGNAFGAAHGDGYSLEAGSATVPGGGVIADDFHVFGVDWAPDKITWSVDGTAYGSKTPADTEGQPWAFDHPFYLLLNIAVGGDWPGSPDGTTPFPRQMLVDWVRVSGSGGGGAPPPTEPSPTGPSATGPAPTGPAPTGPAPTGPAPTGPAPTGPAPTQTSPTQTSPTQTCPPNEDASSGDNTDEENSDNTDEETSDNTDEETSDNTDEETSDNTDEENSDNTDEETGDNTDEETSDNTDEETGDNTDEETCGSTAPPTMVSTPPSDDGDQADDGDDGSQADDGDDGSQADDGDDGSQADDGDDGSQADDGDQHGGDGGDGGDGDGGGRGRCSAQ
jgi:beta-glucanase (GH16 family)